MQDVNDLPLDQLYARLTANGAVRRLFELARDEDVGQGDITSAVCIEPDVRARGVIVARSGGTIAGMAALPDLLAVFGSQLSLRVLVSDGQNVPHMTRLAQLTGLWRDILAVERTALNLLGRLSGIATLTAAYVQAARALGPVRAAIYDTRKTTPGLRALEKYAVRCGGGRCHRLGLHDAVLIKDNHLVGKTEADLPRLVAEAARRARTRTPPPAFVEVEVGSLDRLRTMLALPRGTIDVILLDNMSLGDLARAVAMRDASESRPQLEASGGVRLENVAAIARTGVDRISAGAITHSAPALDLALEIEHVET